MKVPALLCDVDIDSEPSHWMLHVEPPPVGDGRNPIGDTARDTAPCRYASCTKNADGLVYPVGEEGPRGNDASVLRRSDEAYLGHGLVRDIAQVHHRSDLQADRFDAIL